MSRYEGRPITNVIIHVAYKIRPLHRCYTSVICSMRLHYTIMHRTLQSGYCPYPSFWPTSIIPIHNTLI